MTGAAPLSSSSSPSFHVSDKEARDIGGKFNMADDWRRGGRALCRRVGPRLQTAHAHRLAAELLGELHQLGAGLVEPPGQAQLHYKMWKI